MITCAHLGVVGIHSALVAGLGNGTPQTVIQRELPRAQASRAREAVMENGHHGKNRAGAVGSAPRVPLIV